MVSSSLASRSSIVPWAAAATAAIAPWIFHLTGHPWPRRLTQVAVAGGLALLALFVARTSRRAFRVELARNRPLAWALLALVVLSFVAHFAGLSFEVGRGYYKDEGIYRSTAQRIHEGDALPRSFIYGHLPFYLAAWTLWLRELFVGPTGWLVTTFSSLDEGGKVTWLMLRVWSGLFGALTVLPVVGAARRILGLNPEDPDSPTSDATPLIGGLLAGALIVACTLYNEVTHLYISDVPAAFFAALALGLTARLLERESTSGYVWAGIASGLAAASKYPAGFVAFAIIAVWLVWRWRERRWHWGLFVAGAAAIVALVAVMPAIVAHADRAFDTGRGKNIFFGARQYSGKGWAGVVKDSNLDWYLGRLRETFGGPALLVGSLGLFALDRKSARRWLTLAAFPLAYGVLVLSMNVSVPRNLLPLLPAAAVLLGAGSAGAAAWLARSGRRPGLAPAAISLFVLAAPLVSVVQQTIAFSSPGTRELTADWIVEHLPPGAGIVKELYTPDFGGAYDVFQTRFASRVDPELLASGRYEFVVLAKSGYSRFLGSETPEEELSEERAEQAERYRALLERPELFAIDGSATRLGPGFTVRRLEPESAPTIDRRTFTAWDAAITNRRLRGGQGGFLVFTPEGDLAAFKERLSAGRYQLTLDGESIERGRIELFTIERKRFAALEVGNDPLQFDVATPQKVFFQVDLNPGARLQSLTVAPATVD